MDSFLVGHVTKPVSVYFSKGIEFQFRNEATLVRFINMCQNLALPEDARVFRTGDTYLVARERHGIALGLAMIKEPWESE